MTQLVRRYDIGGLIAEGGMAEIVAASAMTEAGVSKRVALKRIRTGSSGDPQFVARFFDEVRLAMQLSHANVVQVFDFGRTEAHEFFLAMEFVEGVDLAAPARGREQRPPAARPKRCSSSRRCCAASTTRTAAPTATTGRSASSTWTSSRRTSCCRSRAR